MYKVCPVPECCEMLEYILEEELILEVNERHEETGDGLDLEEPEYILIRQARL